jgi:hypothetical protein
MSEPSQVKEISFTRALAVLLFSLALIMAMISLYNYLVNIGPKYYPINQAGSLLFDACNAHTAEEKEWCIQEANRLYFQEAQTNDKPLMIELRSLTPQNTTDEFNEVHKLLYAEFGEKAYGSSFIPALVMSFILFGGGYLALGKHKRWDDKVKVFMFTSVGTLEFCFLIFVIL